MKTAFLALTFVVLLPVAVMAQDVTAPAIATGGPIDLSGSIDAPETTPISSDICRQANKARMSLCPRVKVDCKKVLAEADAKLIDQIQRCPITDDFEPFVGDSVVGYVPCCVAMGQTQQE